jgi:D-glycero-alpha-D-manno-heptose 1-phosphate guanylyltransferase
LAGGLGTRLREVVNDVPKSMALINERPFLEYLLDFLDARKINTVVLATGYRSHLIKGHFKSKYKSLKLLYAAEPEPLGTGGGIRNAFHKITGEDAFVFNGDSLFLTDLEAMAALHKKENAMATLALREAHDTGRFGTVTVNPSLRIRGFAEKKAGGSPGYINAGVYILNRPFLLGTLFREKFSLEKDCFEKYYREVPMFGFPSDGYFLDIGIPEDFAKAQDEFKRLRY